jgi:hypothetical protein
MAGCPPEPLVMNARSTFLIRTGVCACGHAASRHVDREGPCTIDGCGCAARQSMLKTVPTVRFPAHPALNPAALRGK